MSCCLKSIVGNLCFCIILWHLTSDVDTWCLVNISIAIPVQRHTKYHQLNWNGVVHLLLYHDYGRWNYEIRDNVHTIQFKLFTNVCWMVTQNYVLGTRSLVSRASLLGELALCCVLLCCNDKCLQIEKLKLEWREKNVWYVWQTD